ncbi:UNC93-like protein MFSD11 isoform X2 [Rhodnius prolixus]|uniref:UNC93-like protein MFSD11 isoform X2 n=1 Tax=Rhodnius prolixus TaxID=13249 RepID=UPI003D18CC01
MLIPFDRQVFNIVHLGIAFLVIFSADFTVTNMQKTINASIKQDKPWYNVDGYVSLGLVYLVYGIFLWLAPSVVALVGTKLALLIGAMGITIFMFSLTLEILYVTYIGIFLTGVGGSFLWVGEGHYVVLNSDPETMSRNVGLFWFLYSSSLIFGNLYAVFQLTGKTRIDYDTRHRLLYVLGSLGAIGCILLALLGPPKRHNSEIPIRHEGPVQALKKTWKIFRTKKILILLLTFIFGGFQQSFGGGIYPPSVGFTQEFGNKAKQLVPMCGLVYGLGDSIGFCFRTGGLVNMLLRKMRLKISKRSIVITGFILEAIAFCIIFINIPSDAVFGETSKTAIIKSNMWLALLSSFLIGIGDSCLNTQIFPLIAELHPQFSAHTCALYKFTKSVSMAIFFFCSNSLGLHLQLIILIVLGLIGTIAFVWVDYKESIGKTEKNNTDVTAT